MGGGILTEVDFTEPRSATVVQVRCQVCTVLHFELHNEMIDFNIYFHLLLDLEAWGGIVVKAL
jgi:hypothetical protein